MGSISMPQGKGNIQHNIRGYGEGKMPKNIEMDRTCENVVWKHETVAQAYHRIFDGSVKEYNDKQKRADRKIKNYHQHILNSKNGEKEFYEDVLQWGKKEDFENHPELREIARDCLLMYLEGSKELNIPSFAERNPGLELIGAYIHMDEASPHMHFDYIPVAEGYKTGMKKRNSLDRTMKNLLQVRTGHEYSPRTGEVNASGKCIDNATKQWKELERSIYRSICLSHNLLVEEEIPTPERDSLSVLDYKVMVRKEEAQHWGELSEALHGQVLSTAEAESIDIHKPIIGQKVKVSYHEVASLRATAEEIDSVKKNAEADVLKANERADKCIIEANERADKAIKEINDDAQKQIRKANERADKREQKAEEREAEANEIIMEKNSILKGAKREAKRIIDEAIEAAKPKVQAALDKIKKEISILKGEKKELEADIKEKTGIGDAILAKKKEQANSILDDATKQSEDIVNVAKNKVKEIQERAIKDAGMEGVAREINRRLNLVSKEELSDAWEKVIHCYQEYKKYDTNGEVAMAIESRNIELIKEIDRDATVYSSNGTVKEWKPWHDEILNLDMAMNEFMKLEAKPSTIDEVEEQIQRTMNKRPTGYGR